MARRGGLVTRPCVLVYENRPGEKDYFSRAILRVAMCVPAVRRAK